MGSKIFGPVCGSPIPERRFSTGPPGCAGEHGKRLRELFLFSLEKGRLQNDLRAAFQCSQRVSRSKSLPGVYGGRIRDSTGCKAAISAYEEKLFPHENSFVLEQVVWRVCTAFAFSASIEMSVAQTCNVKCCLYLQALLPWPSCLFRGGIGPAATFSDVSLVNGIFCQPFVFKSKYHWCSHSPGWDRINGLCYQNLSVSVENWVAHTEPFLGSKKPNQLIVQIDVRIFQISSDHAEGDMLGIVISLMIIWLQGAVYS